MWAVYEKGNIVWPVLSHATAHCFTLKLPSAIPIFVRDLEPLLSQDELWVRPVQMISEAATSGPCGIWFDAKQIEQSDALKLKPSFRHWLV